MAVPAVEKKLIPFGDWLIIFKKDTNCLFKPLKLCHDRQLTLTYLITWWAVKCVDNRWCYWPSETDIVGKKLI